MTRQSETGQLGENAAAKYLKKKGYKIIERNYGKRWGEVDIIAISPEKVLVFIEVKTATGQLPYVEPEDHLTRAKLRRLQRTSEFYANDKGAKFLKEDGWRIDLLAVVLDGRDAGITHYENI
jgi:putative endonuclease